MDEQQVYHTDDASSQLSYDVLHPRSSSVATCQHHKGQILLNIVHRLNERSADLEFVDINIKAKLLAQVKDRRRSRSRDVPERISDTLIIHSELRRECFRPLSRTIFPQGSYWSQQSMISYDSNISRCMLINVFISRDTQVT